jgi:histone acetyltransferase (RNA polymerase elongator complex component)
VYCNQRASTSTGVGGPEREGSLDYIHERITRLASEARRLGIPGELAFYGGTFTALPLEWLEALLHGALPFIEEGLFSGIRFSTRPDAMSPAICEMLGGYPIRTVELGVQSLSDEVLRRSRRGYTAQTVVAATRLVRERGWNLGLQLMLGLPGDSRERFLESVTGVVALAPDFVRIYPTIVLTDTVLAHWLAAGRYRPLSLDEAVEWCAMAYDRFFEEGILVIRMGLHPDPELLTPGVIVGGPFHPAFGYLVKVRWWRTRVDGWCIGRNRAFQGERIVLRVAREVVSEVLGPSRENTSHWQNLWGCDGIDIVPMANWSPARLEAFTKSGIESGVPCATVDPVHEVEAHDGR